ncbi:hypothetical protein [uncultured Mediterranean phage]|nr:hypothetical protein [uncultured Mediterranean phage]
MRLLGKRYVKIAIIGYKNHAIRLKETLNKLGYNNVFTYNHKKDELDSLNDSDIFFISSPNDTHYYWIKLLQKYNKYIFCEKPPVTTLDDLKEITSYNEKLYFNFNHRFTGLSKLAEKYLNSEELGKLLYINCIITNGIAFKESFKNDWRFKGDDILSSIIGNLGIHYIDLVGYLCGDIKEFNLEKLSVVSEELPDTTKMYMITDNVIVDIFLSYAAPFRNQVTMLFDNGILELLDGKVTLQTPRDTIDKDGRFKPPDYMYLEIFNNSKEYYDNSLFESVGFFMKCYEQNKSISVKHYNQSIKTTKLLLDTLGEKHD